MHSIVAVISIQDIAVFTHLEILTENIFAGFVGSGPVVLLLELADRIGPTPARSQQVLLYSTVAVITYIGAIFQNLSSLFLAFSIPHCQNLDAKVSTSITATSSYKG